MKVALVQAPVFDLKTPSNGLALLSAHLKNAGIECSVHDASRGVAKQFMTLLKDDFRDSRTFLPVPERHAADTSRFLDMEADRILAGGPDAVGFSVLARTEKHSLELAAKIKERAPRCRVIFGGAQCLRENLAFDFIADPAVDAVALGEADISFPRFLSALDLGSRDCAPSPGMLVKRGGKVVDGGEPEVITALDSLPYLDLGAFDLDDYDGMILYLSTTRGCVRKCSFCTHIVGQKTYRTMSAVRTVAEIRHQMKLYPKRDNIEFTDSLINGNVRRLAEMSDLLVDYRLERVAQRRHGNWDFGWSGMAIIHPTMSPELLRKMRRSGCIMLRYGMESASQKVLDSMQKNVRVRDAETVIKDTADAGIKVFLYVLVGFPTENEADFQETLDFIERHARHIKQIGVSSCEIQKGSHLDVHPEAYGIKLPLEDRLRWETVDGSNTYAVREDRTRRINLLVERLGLGSYEFPTRLGSTLAAAEPEYEFYKETHRAGAPTT
jgi:anaerobic magnesium-protoporphyrin IX monomethyl ester cyclase